MTDKSALLVIDVQIDNIRPDGPYPFDQNDVTRMINAINDMVADYQDNSMSVIFIRQIYEGFLGKLVSKLLLGSVTIVGTEGANLDPRLNSASGQVLDKSQQNAFYKTELSDVLHQQGITKLQIMGLDGAYCVGATAKAALDLGFEVELLDTAIISNKPEKWKKIKEELLENGAACQTVSKE